MGITITAPDVVDLTDGPVSFDLHISGVPEDVAVGQMFTVQVGPASANVQTTVTVDNPEPVVADPSAAPAVYSVEYMTPIDDGDGNWRVPTVMTRL